MRRLTKREKLRETVRSFDAFTKVEPDMNIQQTSNGGAFTTIVAASLILFLVISELTYYQMVDIKYNYAVDIDTRQDLNLTMDLTVAMKCEHLGADYMDSSGKSIDSRAFLAMEPAHFQLSPNQQEWADEFRAVKDAEGSRGLDSLNRFLHGSMREPMPAAAPEIGTPPDACRIFGMLPITKVAANFHITAGTSVHHARGHSHMAQNVPLDAYNFSHRVDRFSFSEELVGAHALDGDLKTADNRRLMYQYFLTIVPSTTQRLGQAQRYRSNQYSVREQETLMEGNMAQGIPGIYFKYSFEALAVHIYEDERSMGQFFIRLCGIVGGIFSTSGMLHQMLGAIVDVAKGKN